MTFDVGANSSFADRIAQIVDEQLNLTSIERRILYGDINVALQ